MTLPQSDATPDPQEDPPATPSSPIDFETFQKAAAERISFIDGQVAQMKGWRPQEIAEEISRYFCWQIDCEILHKYGLAIEELDPFESVMFGKKLRWKPKDDAQ